MNRDQIEREILDKGLAAPRITPADIEANIEANIVSEHYFTAAEGLAGANMDVIGGQCVGRLHKCPAELMLLTFCILVLKNGFTVTGESACASPENFDTELGRKIARKNAIESIWPLMGYELRSKLSGR